MEISLERKTATVYNSSECPQKLCEISCDIVVPDTNEDIIRLLAANAKYKLLSKELTNGKVSVSGELEISAAYIPESGTGIGLLSHIEPFDCSLDSSCDDDSAFVLLDIEIKSVDTRILNPRKISVKVKLLICADCYSLGTIEWYEKPKSCDKKAFFKEQRISAYLCDIACEKQFSLENDFELPGAGETDTLFSSEARYYTDSAEAVGGKLIIKGHCALKLLFLCGGSFKCSERSVPFSQIFDLTQRDTLPEFDLKLLPTGESIELNNGQIEFELHGIAQLICMRKTELGYVKDAYLCGESCELRHIDIPLCTRLDSREEVKSVRLSFTSDAPIQNVELFKLCFGKARKDESGFLIPLVIDAVILSGDTLRPCRLTEELSAEFYPTELSLLSLTPNINSDELDFHAEIKLSVKSSETAAISSVAAIICDNIPPENNASLLLTKATDGIWALGKKYCADLELIKLINGIDDEESLPERLLLIPKP